MRLRLEVRCHGVWWPARQGRNRAEDETLSTFYSVADAAAALEADVLPLRPQAVRLSRADGEVVFLMCFGAAPAKGTPIARVALVKKGVE